jgi:formate hydrogenlyase transcriptional activator
MPVFFSVLAESDHEEIGDYIAADNPLGGPQGAASRLGMRRSTLQWKMKKLGISRPE